MSSYLDNWHNRWLWWSLRRGISFQQWPNSKADLPWNLMSGYWNFNTDSWTKAVKKCWNCFLSSQFCILQTIAFDNGFLVCESGLYWIFYLCWYFYFLGVLYFDVIEILSLHISLYVFPLCIKVSDVVWVHWKNNSMLIVCGTPVYIIYLYNSSHFEAICMKITRVKNMMCSSKITNIYLKKKTDLTLIMKSNSTIKQQHFQGLDILLYLLYFLNHSNWTN